MYRNVFGRDNEISEETTLAVLRAIGAPIEGPQDAPDALRASVAAFASRPCDPVTVAWTPDPVRVRIRLPSQVTGVLRCTVAGAEHAVSISDVEPETSQEVDGIRYVVRTITLPDALDIGRHTLRISLPDGSEARTVVLRAPVRVPVPRPGRWGVFAPLYALRSHRDWGIGDLTDLTGLFDRVTSLGGDVVSTLPLFATFDGEPSPYSPVSRLAWNELYCDPAREPEFSEDLLPRGLDALRRADLLDHAEVARLKGAVLTAMSSRMSDRRRDALERFCAERPVVDDHAAFRGACARHGVGWSDWPESARDGQLSPADVHSDVVRFHRYAQWITAEQLSLVAERAKGQGCDLYIDLPLGSGGHGYDVWRHRDAFVAGVAAGAPPDMFFRAGQNWAFPPPHPHDSREDGHGYIAAVLRNVLAYASLLRIDHVMGLHRLWVIPEGAPAAEGTYVTYPSEELYATLAIEAHGAGASVVGEDLGTVPAEVREGMKRHGLQRSWVLQYELRPEPADPHDPVPLDALATLNTHDMAPFAGFWDGSDIDRLEQLGFFTAAEAATERRVRQGQRTALTTVLRAEERLPTDLAGQTEQDALSPGDVGRACVERLAESDARLVIVTLEDLWGETEPQNVPGTVDDYPNWRRRLRYPLEALWGVDAVTDTLGRVDRSRKGKR